MLNQLNETINSDISSPRYFETVKWKLILLKFQRMFKYRKPKASLNMKSWTGYDRNIWRKEKKIVYINREVLKWKEKKEKVLGLSRNALKVPTKKIIGSVLRKC